jgi:hypothetical protein
MNTGEANLYFFGNGGYPRDVLVSAGLAGGQYCPQDWDSLALNLEDSFLVSSPSYSHYCLLKMKKQPITRSNYLPSASFLAVVAKSLAKTLLHKYPDPKSPKSARGGLCGPGQL